MGFTTIDGGTGRLRFPTGLHRFEVCNEHGQYYRVDVLVGKCTYYSKLCTYYVRA